MSDHDMKSKLENLLATLKRNKEQVPITELKTKYKKGYENLCKEISEISSLFVRHILFKDLQMHKDLLDEAIPRIHESIKKSGYPKKLSIAVFCHQDITELETLAHSLRILILTDLELFYAKHICLYLTEECLLNPSHSPLVYNAATGCIWDNGSWRILNECPSSVLSIL